MLFLGAAEWLLPVTIAKTNQLWFEELKGKVMLGIKRNNRYYYKGKDGFYSFTWPVKEHYVFKEFSYSEWDENYNIHTLTTATFANWYPEKDNWMLTVGQTQNKNDQTEEYEIQNFTRIKALFPESPEDFLIPANKAAELSLTGLFDEAEQADVEHESRKAWTNFLGRISYIFLGLPLLLLGLPILLYSYRKWGRDLSVAIPVSCGLAFIAWGLWGAMQSLAIAGYISPLFAACGLHVVFALAGFFLLVKNDR